jgi:HEAT repeat protein
MTKIHRRVLALSLASLFVLATVAWCVTLRARQSGKQETTGGVNSTQASLCKNNIDIRINVERLASSAPEANQAVDRLLSLGKDSPECRKETISELLRAMNKLDLDFETDRPSYLLWSNGAAILGDLKAVEALDLLIEHLNLNDGVFSASMAHQPAVLGIEKIGVAAVPKLRIALQHNPSRDIRLSAALCLADIGGTQAIDALKEALGSETDQCVRRFITLSLPSPTDQVNPEPRPPTGEVLRQRLLAFRCGN